MIPSFSSRFSSLQVAGKKIRVAFVSRTPPRLPKSADVLRRWSDTGSSLRSVYWRIANPRSYRLYWSDAGTFDLDPEKQRVRCFLRARASANAVEEVLRGPVCSFFVMEQGLEPLHAGAVVIANRCLAFVGRPGAGKSTLVAWLTRMGARFLTDDLLPLRWRAGTVRALPGLPQLRLAPIHLHDLAGKGAQPRKNGRKYTLPMDAGSARVSYPLALVYVLDRVPPSRHAAATLSPMSPLQAFQMLVENTSNSALDAGWRLRKQMQIYGWIAANVPTRRLVYPGGVHHLAQVRELLLKDLESGPPAGPAAR